MEGLSAAASGIAVVSVAIQLAESFKKLSDFWKSIKEAPEDIRAISTDLDLVSSVLAETAREAQHVGPDDTLVAVLDACCGKVKVLTGIVNQIEPGFASTSSRVRRWTAFRAVLKRGELMKFQEALERLKGTLLMVQQNQCNRLIRNRLITLEQSPVAIIHSVSSSSMQQHSLMTGRVSNKVTNALDVEGWDDTDFGTGNVSLVQSHHSSSGESRRKPALAKRTLRETDSVIETFLGTIRATSTTTLHTLEQTGDLIPHGENQSKTSFTIYPAQWLIRLGVQCGFHLDLISSSTQGWKNSLNTFCPVPDDALIFEFCRQGNVSAVRSLLSGGHASVRDTNSQGYTPLHFAAENHHPQLCEILKSAGADMYSITNDAETPFILAADRSEDITPAMLSEVFDTIRLLTDSIDFSEENSHGWDIMENLTRYASLALGRSPLASGNLLVSMLRLLSFELKTYVVERKFAEMLSWTIQPEFKLAEACDLLLNLGGHGIIDAALFRREGYSVLHDILTTAHGEDMVTCILERGPNIHLLGFDTYHSPYKESPTSLAMYSSTAFTSWVRGLVNTKVDLESFIDKELEQNPEVHPGWERETLLELFTHGDRPDLHFGIGWNCSDCTEEIIFIRIQPYWRHLIQRIKEKRHHYEPDSADSEAEEEDDDDNELQSELKLEVEGSEPSSNYNLEEHDDELQSKSESEEVISEYDARGPIGSKCLYDRHELVCMDCWLYYARTGTRRLPFEEVSEIEDLAFSDDSSEDEFSPFHIHS